MIPSLLSELSSISDSLNAINNNQLEMLTIIDQATTAVKSAKLRDCLDKVDTCMSATLDNSKIMKEEILFFTNTKRELFDKNDIICEGFPVTVLQLEKLRSSSNTMDDDVYCIKNCTICNRPSSVWDGKTNTGKYGCYLKLTNSNLIKRQQHQRSCDLLLDIEIHGAFSIEKARRLSAEDRAILFKMYGMPPITGIPRENRYTEYNDTVERGVKPKILYEDIL